MESILDDLERASRPIGHWVLLAGAALAAVALGPPMVPTLTEVVFPIVALAVADLVEAIVVVLVLDGTMVLARPVVSLMVAKRLPKPSFGSDIIDVENSERFEIRTHLQIWQGLYKERMMI